jgi:putative effector of murein hydrolase LrgA (UPF0299 family)
MNKEKDFIVLISIATFGVLIASALPTILHKDIVAPVVIFALIMFPLVLLQDRKKFVNLTENIEKIFFFITLFAIAISFAILYKPF